MNKARLLGAAALGLMVAACGTDPRERTTGGAAAGAATGAAVGALGGPVGALAGAGIGGAAGAVTGAATDPQDVNLGRPLWNDPEVRVPGVQEGGGRSARGGGAVATRSSAETRQIQQALASRGYDPGPADGVWGAQTQQAANRFQRDNNISGGRQSLASALGVSGGSMTGSDSRAQGASGSGRTTRESDRAYMGGGMTGDPANRNTMGGTGRDATRGAPPGNTDARTGATMGVPGTGVGGSLGGGRGAPGTLSSPDNPGVGSSGAGSSSQ
jgi:hypothetical protein